MPRSYIHTQHMWAKGLIKETAVAMRIRNTRRATDRYISNKSDNKLYRLPTLLTDEQSFIKTIIYINERVHVCVCVCVWTGRVSHPEGVQLSSKDIAHSGVRDDIARINRH